MISYQYLMKEILKKKVLFINKKVNDAQKQKFQSRNIDDRMNQRLV